MASPLLKLTMLLLVVFTALPEAIAQTLEVSVSSARVRYGASTRHRIVGHLSRGQKVQAIGQSRDKKWYRVKIGRRIGWMHKSLFRPAARGSGMQAQAACQNCTSTNPGVSRPVQDVVELAHSVTHQTSAQSADANCYSRALLASAKELARTKWGNRSNSGGRCALGVRQMLQNAGIHGGSGGLGHAIDYHSSGNLKRLGFVNMIGTYKTAQAAPPGAVLVFSGPNTSQYLRNGRMRRPYGDYVGHVAIKGDDGMYYTDGRTSYPAVRNRTLVGIYVFQECKNCSRRARTNANRACGRG